MKTLPWLGCCCAMIARVAPNVSSAEFVKLTAEIEMAIWSPDDGTNFALPYVKSSEGTVDCVVGTSQWEITRRGFNSYGESRSWFTGSNILVTFVQTGPLSDRKELYERSFGPMPAVGQRHTMSFDCADGNPGRPARVADAMDVESRIAWLAFCSGSVLKGPAALLFPPDDLWKELIAGDFTRKTSIFEDDFGLPQSLALYAHQSYQPLFQYRVTATTNVNERTFPLEFHLAQYGPCLKGWSLRLTAKGTVKAIAEHESPPRQ